ncbi:MAG: hypothetical protein ACO3JL_05130, partial [Myxococcota bacterium]
TPPNEVQRPPPRGALRASSGPTPASQSEGRPPSRAERRNQAGPPPSDRSRSAAITPDSQPPTTSKKTSVKDGVATLLRCGLPSPCGKAEIGAAFALRYKSMSDDEKRDFENQVERCLARCPR